MVNGVDLIAALISLLLEKTAITHSTSPNVEKKMKKLHNSTKLTKTKLKKLKDF